MMNVKYAIVLVAALLASACAQKGADGETEKPAGAGQNVALDTTEERLSYGIAYGLGERLIVSRLALRNALVPVLTIIGLTLAYLITGTFFVEIVFSWPGLGTFAVKSILATDYPAIMGIALFGAAAYVFINLVVDLAQAWVDPRIRLT